jgi:hypothetical protein
MAQTISAGRQGLEVSASMANTNLPPATGTTSAAVVGGGAVVATPPVVVSVPPPAVVSEPGVVPPSVSGADQPGTDDQNGQQAARLAP